MRNTTPHNPPKTPAARESLKVVGRVLALSLAAGVALWLAAEYLEASREFDRAVERSNSLNRRIYGGKW